MFAEGCNCRRAAFLLLSLSLMDTFYCPAELCPVFKPGQRDEWELFKPSLKDSPPDGFPGSLVSAFVRLMLLQIKTVELY